MKENKYDSENRPETLWVVSELYYPEETSTGYYLTRIAEGLSGEFTVRVLCGQPNYSARGKKAPKTEVRRGVEIFRAFGTTLDKNVIVFRLINMLTLSFSIWWKALLKYRKGDRVLVVTTPPSLPFISALAALFRGAGYYLLIHDNYPEILVAAGKTTENSVPVRVLNFLNRWLYKYSSGIIVCGRDMEELVRQKTAGLDLPVWVVQNWAELETVEPLPRDRNKLLAETGLTDKLVFLYAGNMGYPNDVESLIECAERLVDDPRFAFIFLGAGVKRKWIERRVEKKGLQNVTLLDPRPRRDQIDFLNAGDVGIVSLVRKMRGVSMPSRTYNILAAGKPILALAEPDSEISRVIEEDRVGWVVAPGDPDTLLKTVLSIYEQRADLGRLGRNARQSAVEKYSVEVALGKLLEIFKKRV
ncbi:MAG: glycosyltransferase family 4 protein [Acidobacteria bacterium]|nr:glycosyltransferase family 4 protein [Acidobacteriota bacterium]